MAWWEKMDTVTRDGFVYAWCSDCQGWWLVVKDRIRTHRIWDGLVAPQCAGSLTDPATHTWIRDTPSDQVRRRV